jgi:nucleoside-diphosphate-sugar epimerase
MLLMTRLLITGAAGRLGTVLTRHLVGRYDLVLSDVNPIRDSYGCAVVPGDIADMKCVQRMVQGVDQVIHLAANPDAAASWETLLQPNIIGLYNIFEAACTARCRRVIFASSIHAVMGYPADQQIHAMMPARPPDLYGATKVWGEAVARYYADKRDLSALCLRLGWVTDRDDPALQLSRDNILARPHDDDLDMVLTHEDLARLILACIEAPETLRFGIFHGISDNRWKRLDISDARAALGYQPRDDAFAIATRRVADEVLI